MTHGVVVPPQVEHELPPPAAGPLRAEHLEPFLQAARLHGAGVFFLVRTSNAGAADVQDLALSDGSTVWRQVARLVHEWSLPLVGDGGLSSVGAVVGGRTAGVWATLGGTWKPLGGLGGAVRDGRRPTVSSRRGWRPSAGATSPGATAGSVTLLALCTLGRADGCGPGRARPSMIQ